MIRTVEGPIASIRSERPDELSYVGVAAPLRDVWVALRASMRTVLERVTLADVAKGELPAEILRLTEAPDVWEPHY
jgi:DNA-binding IscR family transcriptional regulator